MILSVINLKVAWIKDEEWEMKIGNGSIGKRGIKPC